MRFLGPGAVRSLAVEFLGWHLWHTLVTCPRGQIVGWLARDSRSGWGRKVLQGHILLPLLLPLAQ